MIKTTSKALEYLSMHGTGDEKTLRRKISEDQISLSERSHILIIKDGKYQMTEEGKEIYLSEYASKEHNLLGL